MAAYFPVSPLYWDDEKVVTWPDAQQLLGIYLLTCKHRNLEGFYKLPLNYIAEDKGWSPAKAKKHLTGLVGEGFVEYDWDAKVVLLPNALKFYAPSTRPQIKGALADLSMVPATPLKDRFLQRARELAPSLYDALVNGLPDES